MLYLVLLLVVASLGLLIAALTTANTIWAWASVVISVVAGGLLVLDWIRNRRRSRAAPAADGRSGPAARNEPVVHEPIQQRDQLTAAPAPDPAEATLSHPAVPDATATDTPGGGPPETGTPERHDTAVSIPTGAVPTGPIPVGASSPGTAGPVAGERRADTVHSVEPVRPADTMRSVEPVSAAPVSTGGASRVPAPAIDPDVEPAEENTDASDLLVVSELPDEVLVVDERPRYHLHTCAWLGTKPTLPVPVSEARQLGFTPCAHCGPDAELAARHRSRRARA